MHTPATVRVKHDDGTFRIINASDFNPKADVPFGDEDAAALGILEAPKAAPARRSKKKTADNEASDGASGDTSTETPGETSGDETSDSPDTPPAE